MSDEPKIPSVSCICPVCGYHRRRCACNEVGKANYDYLIDKHEK